MPVNRDRLQALCLGLARAFPGDELDPGHERGGNSLEQKNFETMMAGINAALSGTDKR
jgi:hypothetical protein